MSRKKRCIRLLKKSLGSSNVLTDWSALHAYSSDASPYAVTPTAVVLIENPNHAELAAEICRSYDVTIHPRGGGSGLAGGALGSGVIFDFTRMNRIKRIDVAAMTVDVEAGLLLDDLNERLAPMGLMFAPDPSSGDTCRIGGMLANNSSGPRSVKYGQTSNHIEMLDILLPDGNRFQIKDVAVDSAECNRLFSSYRPFEVVYRIISANVDLIKSNFPRLCKNTSGYNLLAVVDKLEQGIFSLSRLFVGSEGTLGMFLGATLKLTKKPSSKATLQVLFDSIDEAGEAVPGLLTTAPAALEIIDGSTMDLIGRERFGIPKTADAMLIVEFDDPPFDEKVEAIRSLTSQFKLSSEIFAESDPKKQGELWKARKSIVPTLYKHKGRAKPFGFIEDLDVPTERVAQIIRYVNGLFENEGLAAGIFGHIGDGNVHLRPVIDLSTSAGLKLARKLYDLVYDEVISLGGSITAEHGDGRLRAPLVRKLYGEELYHIFEKIRQELNPELSVNPDIVLSDIPFTDNFDFEKLTRLCASCGKCNYYCPAFEVHGSEEMAARGWVRIMLTSEYTHKRARRLMDECLNCKNCLMICPAGVDVSRYVTERRSERKGLIAKKIFKLQSRQDDFEKWVKRFGKVNAMIDKPILRPIVHYATAPLIQLDKHRILPHISRETLPERYPDLVENSTADVAYFYGCADKMLELGSGPAAISVMKKAGFALSLPDQFCCGMPQQTYGFFDYELDYARKNIDSLLRFKYVVTTCATCLGELLHYRDLFDDDPEYKSRAETLAERCYDIAEFLYKHAGLKFIENKKPQRVAFHQPCHLRESGNGRVEMTHKLIDSLPGISFVPMADADRCCGAAGTYNVIHYKDSMKLFERKKSGFARSGADIVTSSCPTCVLQFVDGLKDPSRVKHVVELIDEFTC